MVTCSTFPEKVIGNFLLRLSSPYKTCAMVFPRCCPKCHAFTIAEICSTDRVIADARSLFNPKQC